MKLAPLTLLVAFSTGVALAQFEAPAANPKPRETAIRMPSGRTLTMRGAWTETKVLGGDQALVFVRWARDHRELVSLDAGTREPRVIAQLGPHEGSLFRSMTWAPDGSACYAWLSRDRQFCRIDARTGEIRSFTAFPSHRATWCSASLHCDPAMVPRSAGVVTMNDMLLFVLREEPTRKPPVDPASGERFGSSWLAALDPADGSMVELSTKRWPSRHSDPWDISRSRRTLYRTTQSRQELVATTFDGTVLWSDSSNGHIRSISLSPDEQWLLLERSDYHREGFVIVSAEDGSFHGALSRGFPLPPRGCAWSPDSKRVAFLDGWSTPSLCIYDVEQRSDVSIAALRGMEYGASWSRPLWSQDGRMLFTNIGEEHNVHQLFDLTDRTVLVLDHGFEYGNVSFAPMAKPFAAD